MFLKLRPQGKGVGRGAWAQKARPCGAQGGGVVLSAAERGSGCDVGPVGAVVLGPAKAAVRPAGVCGVGWRAGVVALGGAGGGRSGGAATVEVYSLVHVR